MAIGKFVALCGQNEIQLTSYGECFCFKTPLPNLRSGFSCRICSMFANRNMDSCRATTRPENIVTIHTVTITP